MCYRGHAGLDHRLKIMYTQHDDSNIAQPKEPSIKGLNEKAMNPASGTTVDSHFKVSKSPKQSLKRKHSDDSSRHQGPLLSVPQSHSLSQLAEFQRFQEKESSSESFRVENEPQVQLREFCLNQGIYIFSPGPEEKIFSVAERYLLVEKRLCQNLLSLNLPPLVNCVYNCLEYAFDTHRDFVLKYGNACRKILFVGMNPGPYGMVQNGVPFGEKGVVQEWLGIQGQVLKPLREHPKRPILGLDCKRSEVSGARFWGLFQKLCGRPSNFFATCFVHNVCPLAFMAESGKNITPPELPASTQRQINAACETALMDVIYLMKPEIVVGVGKFAHECVQKVLRQYGITSIRTTCLMHPSPGNPAANKGWEAIALGQMGTAGVLTAMGVDCGLVERLTAGLPHCHGIGRPPKSAQSLGGQSAARSSEAPSTPRTEAPPLATSTSSATTTAAAAAAATLPAVAATASCSMAGLHWPGVSDGRSVKSAVLQQMGGFDPSLPSPSALPYMFAFPR